MPIRRALRKVRAVNGLVGREAGRCEAELVAIRSAGRPIHAASAVAWSVAAIIWGNGVVAAGRRFGHDQWITLVAVPLFGLAGWWWLARRGFRREALGIRFPRTDDARLLNGLTVAAALFVGAGALAALASFDPDMRGLRTVRTIAGTAFGEELTHRGVLLALWANTGLAPRQVLVANMVVFGAWHLAGASRGDFQTWEAIGPAILALPLVWVRLRSRSILAPATFHAASNISGVFN
jgi:membrane protease YdiL (CAAX protease family)